MVEKGSIVGTLRHWRKHICGPNNTCVIWGNIYDDILNRFPDGHFIHTARIRLIEGGFAYTANSTYKLEGEPEGPPYNSYEQEASS